MCEKQNNKAVAKSSAIEVHLQEFNKLFDQMDPSPVVTKDIHPSVAEHIIESARELSARTPLRLIIHVDSLEWSGQNEALTVQAIHNYFSRLAQQSRRRLRLHLRRGVISLLIGLFVLASALTASNLLGEGTVASTLRESLDIGGWVALWRPMEMFLYDWWPIVGDRLRYKRLSHMPVQFVYPA